VESEKKAGPNGRFPWENPPHLAPITFHSFILRLELDGVPSPQNTEMTSVKQTKSAKPHFKTKDLYLKRIL